MTHKEARALIHRFHDALNAHDVDSLTALYAEDAVVVSPMFSTLTGRAAVRQSYEDLFRLAPDYRVQPDESLFIFEGARAADISTVTATHSDRLFGLAPTGHHIEYQIVRLLTFRGSEFLHEQRIYDVAAVLGRLEKARMDDELHVAADIQRTLLPRTHHRGDFFDAVGASRASRAIGGDFFEYCDLPSGAFGLALGDVSGKGPAAALVAAMLQGMFSMEAEQEHSPSLTLSRMNRALLRRRIEPRFSTLMFGVLAPDRRFTYANAGHLPSILVRGNGSVHRLSSGGPILGVFEDAEFPGETWMLEPGDTVVVFSDGVTEAWRTDEEFGDERLVGVVQANRALEPGALLKVVFAAVREFSGEAVPTDDVTLAILRVR
jgi:serine phosphatase RsbU (regulator of sigma subunit)